MMKHILLCLCLTLVPVWSDPVEGDSGPVVVTKHGSVRGQYLKVIGTEVVVEQYLGIPFAQPPVGPLRLAAPQPVQGWEGIRDATQHASMCLQDPNIFPEIAKTLNLEFSLIGLSEDCLYMNIYTPSQRSESDKFPVMVWIPGMSLVMGGACIHREMCINNASPLVAYEKVVVVVIQYRLGILGFLSTGDKHAQGNWGFLDQIAALKWVQQNIEAFGGDPQSVTVAGQSAGGISASLLTLSPMAKGLFQRAIFQSGVATIERHFLKDPSEFAKVVANVTECDFSSSEVLVKCIKEMTEEQLIKAAQKKHIYPGATVDGEFLKNEPEEILKSKEFQKVPILVGTTNHEFGWFFPQLILSEDWEKRMNRKSSLDVLDIFNKASGANGIIAEEYFKNASSPEDIRDAFTEMLGDVYIVIPSIKVASYYRDAGVPVYMYEFQHRLSLVENNKPSYVKADHCFELPFIFGAYFLDSQVDVVGKVEEEKQLSRTVMKYWANFLRTGSPNPAPVPWPVYDQSNKYLSLGVQQTEKQDLKKDKMLFFTEELPKKIAALKSTQTDSGPVVVTKHGSVRGQYLKVIGTEVVVEQYLGIPFAQPPVGPLRLAAPQPVQGWEGIRDATQHASMCLQDPNIFPKLVKTLNMEFSLLGLSEDCLYMNIYTPSQRAESDKFPVMVWIPGMSLVMGGACMYRDMCINKASPLVAYEKVVVVVIQYRLGILGFLSTGDKHAQGNWGFLDQIAALKWVQQNIEAFGGDPQSVTVAGQSAGGISASLLTLSPMTKGLFQRAIFQSGVATIERHFLKDPTEFAKEVANVTECDFSSSEVLVKCIKEMTEEQLIKAAQKKHIYPGATVDGEFLKNEPEEILKSKEFQKVPILVGTTNHEFGWFFPQLILSEDWEKRMNRKSSIDVLDIFNKASGANGIIAEEYFKNASSPEDIRDAFTEMLGDVYIVIPSIKVASYHRDAGVPVYMYEFQHRLSLVENNKPSYVKADHCFELPFMFGAYFLDSQVDVVGKVEEEKKLSRTVMKYWANFLRTGSPNPAPVPWPVYDQSNKYLSLGVQQTEKQDLKKNKMLFFTEELPKKIAALKSTQTDSGPVVVMKHGSVRGQYVKINGSEVVVEQYLGIPFAQPPVGPLRLAPPQPVQGWEGIRNATQQSSMCLQDPNVSHMLSKTVNLELTPLGVSEDCLYLNIYTPSQRSESEKFPVMVWIPGMSLEMGGACMYSDMCIFNASPLVAYEKVVVVVIQYRLGILGFFSTGDEHAQGNWGFLDQIAALQWVQQNIEAFGGDPQSVTVAGMSAGGVSASLLTLSPMTKGLFHRAIFQSGVATVEGYFTKDPSEFAKVVANVTECDFSSSEVLVKCIKEMTEEQLIKAAQKKHIYPGATVDGKFLKNQPEEVLKSKEFQKVPILVGTTNHAFGWMLPHVSFSEELEKGMDAKSAKYILDIFNKVGVSGANGIIAEEYFKNVSTPEDIRGILTEMLGDVYMAIPSIKVASYHRDAGVPVYMYEFQHRLSMYDNIRPSFVKADHCFDAAFLFGVCFWGNQVKDVAGKVEEENQLCRTVMKYWANFLRTGSPNPGPVPWPVFDQSNKYLNLGLQQTEGQDLKKEKMLFFTEELPKKAAAFKSKQTE